MIGQKIEKILAQVKHADEIESQAASDLNFLIHSLGANAPAKIIEAGNSVQVARFLRRRDPRTRKGGFLASLCKEMDERGIRLP